MFQKQHIYTYPTSPPNQKNTNHNLLHSFPPQNAVVLAGLYRIASPEVNVATFSERRVGSEGFWWMVCALVVPTVEMTFWDRKTVEISLARKIHEKIQHRSMVCLHILYSLQEFVAIEKRWCFFLFKKVSDLYEHVVRNAVAGMATNVTKMGGGDVQYTSPKRGLTCCS